MTLFTDVYTSPYRDTYGLGGNALNLRSDVYLGTWTDMTPYIYQRNPVTITRGRQNQSATLTPATMNMTLNNRDARWTIRNPTSPWYGQLKQNSPVRFSVPSSAAGIPAYLRFENDTVSYAWAPDTAALQVTSGILSVRADVRVTNYFPSSFMGKWGTTGQSWVFAMQDDGTITLFHWDGASQFGESSVLPLPYFGGRIAVRADYAIAAKTITFYTAATMGGAWTQLGPVVNTTATALSGAAGQIIQVGKVNGQGMFGDIYEAQILSGVSGSTLVADPVFTAQGPGAASFTDGQSNTWTLVGTAEITDRLYRFHGELASLPKTSDPSQSDVYSDAQAGGLFRRLQQAQTPADSAMKRAWVRYSAEPAVAYWPLEDLATASSFASATGGPPMTWGTKPQLSSNTSFVSSAALPVLANASVAGGVPGYTATDNVVGTLVSVPQGGDTAGGILVRFLTTGTAARVDFVYAGGGGVNLNAYDPAGNQILGQPESLTLDGVPRLLIVTLQQSGPNITWHIDSMTPGSGNAGLSGTLSSATVGRVTAVQLNPGANLTGTAFGHVFVQAVYNSGHLGTLGQPLNAWQGETAAARFARLAVEEGYTSRIIGPRSRSEPMGPQTQQTISALLQECEATDQGLMFEPRQVLGLGYVTRWALYNQPPLCIADFSQAHLMPAFSPASDDQLAVNDVTMTGSSGTSARQFLASGNMSVQSPPAGIGRFDTTVTVNTQTDAALPAAAMWYLHQRSADEDRYPVIPFEMARNETPGTVPLLDTGSHVQVTNPGTWVPTGPVKQLTAGYTETLGPQPLWNTAVNGIPETPYEVAVTSTDRLDAANSSLAAAMTSTQTTLTTAGTSVWEVLAGLPYDINVGGERMTVTTGTPIGVAPQTLTVTRSVNGVVKPQTAGTPIHLWRQAVLAR